MHLRIHRLSVTGPGYIGIHLCIHLVCNNESTILATLAFIIVAHQRWATRWATIMFLVLSVCLSVCVCVCVCVFQQSTGHSFEGMNFILSLNGTYGPLSEPIQNGGNRPKRLTFRGQSSKITKCLITPKSFKTGIQFVLSAYINLGMSFQLAP